MSVTIIFYITNRYNSNFGRVGWVWAKRHIICGVMVSVVRGYYFLRPKKILFNPKNRPPDRANLGHAHHWSVTSGVLNRHRVFQAVIALHPRQINYCMNQVTLFW